MKKVCIVQTRMGSTRLPGKVMMDLCGKPVIWHVINRLKKCKNIDKIIIATTVNKIDDQIENYIEGLNDAKVKIFRGSEEDVLTRYFEAAEKENADFVIRITSDCPLIDAQITDHVIEAGLNSNTYTSNIGLRTFPRGFDTEVFPMTLLTEAFANAQTDFEREHVTPYIREKTKDIAINVANTKDYSAHRWTLDTEEDYTLVRKIYEKLWPKNPDFSFKEILEIFEKEPELFDINSHIQQKTS